MSSILDKPIVLALNSCWQIIGHRSVRQAIVALTGGDRENPPALGLDIVYAKTGDQAWDFDKPIYLNPVKWEEWLSLPVRDFDFFVSTAKQQVRVPTVIVAANFSKMPVAEPRLSREAIYERDAGVCQYTGEFVGRTGNLDHIVPRARGGRDSFENLVWSKSKVNSAKADKLPSEAGLRLIRPPRAPKRVPISSTITEIRHPDWQHFMNHKHSA